MSDEHEETRNATHDEAWLARARDALDPGPRPPARRAAFERALDARLAARRPRWGGGLLAAGSAAAAALALWIAVPQSAVEDGRADAGNLLVYAYYETDYLAEGAAEDDAFMTDEYLAIESAFDLP